MNRLRGTWPARLLSLLYSAFSQGGSQVTEMLLGTGADKGGHSQKLGCLSKCGALAAGVIRGAAASVAGPETPESQPPDI